MCQTNGCENTPNRKQSFCNDCLEIEGFYIFCEELCRIARVEIASRYYNDGIDRMCHVCGKVYEYGKGESYFYSCSKVCVSRRSKAYRQLHIAQIRTTTIETFTDWEIFKRDNYKCYICGNKLNQRAMVPNPTAMTLEHVISLSNGGTHTKDNVKCACFKCNSIKSNNTYRKDGIKYTTLARLVDAVLYMNNIRDGQVKHKH